MYSDITINNQILKIYHTQHRLGRPTIIFLHDSLGCIKLWRDFPEELGELTNCNILVYDRLGYGESAPFITIERDNDYLEKEADILNGLITLLQLKEVILFGHSDGASISLITAAKHPELIKGVIVEGAHIFVEEITLKGIREAEVAYKTTNLKERLQKYHGDKTDAVFMAWNTVWLSDTFRDWNIEHFLSKIVCPVMVIQGENDEFGSMAQLEGIVNQVSGRREKLIIPAIGHTPHKEAPQEVLEKSILFINKL
ncbi:alpha/beta hydrolase [Flavobacterium rakeshii]|uniref:alpha/beta fold hydrolase n=1 Tax=Flavobacterium rakeshii TaxID=1038845 RepID=UPI002E7C56D2|nr:alpha/beta hydrolase [Flavobacterium rakeshii]MEE1898569.1 alpha/beta hydrolase [Flavobacterium rakeshii]